MKPISPPSIIQKGIALFVPNQGSSILTLDIYRSQNNPVFSWLNCSTEQVKLWSKKQSQSETGTLFLYQTSSSLQGFYTLVLSSLNKDGQIKKGQLSVGLLQPTPYLVVGLPYSIYAPIDLA